MSILRIPLANPIESRSANLAKDAVSSNCYFESKSGVKEIVKRPGTTEVEITGDTFGGQGHAGRGLYAWQGSGNDYLYVVSQGIVYKVSTTGVSTTIGTLHAGAAKVSFNQTATVPYLVLNDTIKLYTIKTDDTFASVTSLSSIMFSINSTGLAPGIAYIDGFTVVMTKEGRIYNSDIEDPTSWNALNFVTAEAEPDLGKGIVKHLNYVVAFGEWSTEFFYDAANPTGSPLSRNDTARLEIGCADGNSIALIEQSVLWVGKSKEHGKSVYMLNGLAPTLVSTPSIERFLNASSELRGYSFKIEGHTFYILVLEDLDLSFCFDVNEKQWYNWSSASIVNQQPAIVGIAIAGKATVGSTGSGQVVAETYFRPGYFSEFNNGYYSLDDDTSKIYIISTTVYRDGTNPIYFRSRTPIIDHGSTKLKFYRSIEIVGDKVNGTMQMRHTGDDYNTYSSARSTNLNNKRSVLFKLGADRRRAWEFTCTDNVPVRIQAAEIDVDIGHMEGQGA